MSNHHHISLLVDFHLQGEHDQQTHAPGGEGASQNSPRKAVHTPTLRAVATKGRVVRAAEENARKAQELRAKRDAATKAVEDGFAELNKELERTGKMPADYSEHAAKLDADFQKIFRMNDEIVHTEYVEMRSAMHKALETSRIDTVIEPMITRTWNEEQRYAIGEAIEFVQKITSVNGATIRFDITDKDSPYGHRAYVSGNTVYLDPTSGTSVVVHEIGHVLEKNNPAMARKVQEFLQKRTEGEEAVPLGGQYEPEEIARADNFREAYVGKDYGGQSSEVVAMGLQYLYDNAYDFQKEDEDHFYFTVDAVQGSLSK